MSLRNFNAFSMDIVESCNMTGILQFYSKRKFTTVAKLENFKPITAVFCYDVVNKLILFFKFYAIMYRSTLLFGPLHLSLDMGCSSSPRQSVTIGIYGANRLVCNFLCMSNPIANVFFTHNKWLLGVDSPTHALSYKRLHANYGLHATT